MSQTYFAILTAIGEAKLANATALGTTLQLTQMGVGDGNGSTPLPNRSQTALVRENRRAPLNRLFVDPANASQIIAEQVIPEEIGGWWIREIGLYDTDGNLCAVANCPDTYKPVLAEGSGRTQVIRMVLIVSNTAAVQLKIDPAIVLATRGYVDDTFSSLGSVVNFHVQRTDNPHAVTKSLVGLGSVENYPVANQAEAEAGLASNRFMTPQRVRQAIDSLALMPNDFSGSSQSLSGNGYQKFPGGLILQWGQVQVANISSTQVNQISFPIPFPTAVPKIFVSHLGGISSVGVIVAQTPTPSLNGFSWMSDYTGGNMAINWFAVGW